VLNKYYQQELQQLRVLAREFSEAHPAIAPLLGGPSPDPDVERVLEGVAYLTGLLHRKVDDDFPEIIHGLMDIVFPHYLRPLPSTSIVSFTPKPGIRETIRVPAGISLASVPVEGIRCIFRTCFETEAHPLRLISAETVTRENEPIRIRLTLELSGINLSQWTPSKLTFLTGDQLSTGADLFLFLTRYTRNIILNPVSGGEPLVLGTESLIPVGFEPENVLIPSPTRSFAGYRLLQEYFLLPFKFLFFELRGWERWKQRGNGGRFEIIFELERKLPFTPPRVGSEHFHLFAVPVVNVFSDESEQVLFDHRTDKVRVRPSRKSREHYRVYSVDKVVGYEQGRVTKKEYVPLEIFSRHRGNAAVYQIVHARSPIDGLPELFLSFGSPPDSPAPEPETLSMDVTYTNGSLPERLQLGDISQQTSDSPGLLDFRNIIPPTRPVEPALDGNVLWKFLSHLSLNFLSVANADTLRELLRLYIFQEGDSRTGVAASLKRIEGIEDLTVRPIDRIVNGVIMRGQHVEMTVRSDHYAGTGDMYLFGSVMQAFFGVYSAMNTFIQFAIRDSISGVLFEWPPKLGNRPLM
jgi:type VI secretion system protein ImpG